MAMRYFSDLEASPKLWERIDHAIRLTLAAIYNTTIIIWIIGSSIMPVGFLGPALLIGVEPVLQSTGSCIVSIPLLWRATVFGSLVGIIFSLIFQQIINHSSENGEIIYRALFPFVAGFTAFLFAMTTWIPQSFNGLAMTVALFTFQNAPSDLSFSYHFCSTILFSFVSSFLFKILPLPTAVPVPSSSSLSSKFALRSSLAIRKVERLIMEGRKISATTIGMIANIATTIESDTSINNVHDTTYEHLTLVRVMIKRLEETIVPQIVGLQKAANAELQFLLIEVSGCNCSGSSVESIAKWLSLFRAILPTLQLLSGILSAKHRDITSKSINKNDHGNKESIIPHTVDGWFLTHASIPLWNLSQALKDAIMKADKQPVTHLLEKINKAHTELLKSLSDHRFNLFYKTGGLADDTPKWHSFFRDVALVHGMTRLTSEVAVVTHSVRRFDDDGETETIQHKSDSTSCFNILVSWLKNIGTIFFGDIQWKKPFQLDDRELLIYSFSFCVHIFFATLWFAIPALDDRMNNEGIIVSITTCFIAIGKFGRSFQKAVQRIFGTAVAIIWVVFVLLTLQLTGTQAMIATFPYVFVCLLLIDRTRPYPMDCAAFTAFILLFHDEPFASNDEFLRGAAFRMSTVGIGVIQFIVVEMVFFRSSARSRLEEQCISYFHLVDDVVDGLLKFSSSLCDDMSGEEEEVEERCNNHHEKIFSAIKSSITNCHDSTVLAQDDFVAALEEPGPRIDVKPPFQSRQYQTVLVLQSEINTILLQILDAFHAVIATPSEIYPQYKKAYHRELILILHRMIENLSLPLKNLVINSNKEPDMNATTYRTYDKTWINNLRRFNTSLVEDIVQDGIDQLRRLSISTSTNVTDKSAMIDQVFVLQVCAVSWSLSEISSRFQKTVVCFENIASDYRIILELEKNDSRADNTNDSATISDSEQLIDV